MLKSSTRRIAQRNKCISTGSFFGNFLTIESMHIAGDGIMILTAKKKKGMKKDKVEAIQAYRWALDLYEQAGDNGKVMEIKKRILELD
ncbi:hypothetical protein ABK905_21335 [Acerihabitans sp. KWT182]|uniref:Uncharacterized protein n=1 Tax=Acerihabitans sp. KWT182 TaxID=3157919 RepID=A0AAU7Q7F0_9GAMM